MLWNSANFFATSCNSGANFALQLLHQDGININGCPPRDAPLYQNMDEEATQQLTQQYVDPRRTGTKSLLSLQDEADVLCILLPASEAAIQTVDFVAETAPQHLLQNHSIAGIPEARYTIQRGETRATSPGDARSNESDLASTTFEDGLSPETLSSGRDIALRMSSKLLDPTRGFVFGRGPDVCDVVFKTDQARASNKHFRIFLNRHGVLILEDTSTNGTYVDHTHLLEHRKNRDPERFPERSNPPKQMLNNGSIIELPLETKKREAWMRFIVRLPSRNQALKQYQQNIAAYIQYMEQAERQLQVAKAAHGKLPPAPPVSPTFPI